MGERESSEPALLDQITWRSVVAGIALFGIGVLVGATVLGDLGEVACHEVEEEAQQARDVVAGTFGQGNDGRRAVRELVELADQHPRCFDPEEAEFLRQYQQRSTENLGPEMETVFPTVSPPPSD